MIGAEKSEYFVGEVGGKSLHNKRTLLPYFHLGFNAIPFKRRYRNLIP